MAHRGQAGEHQDRLKANVNTSRRSIFALGAAALASPAFAAADYPNRPIRIVVPFAPGSSVDISARRVGEAMSRTLSKPVQTQRQQELIRKLNIRIE